VAFAAGVTTVTKLVTPLDDALQELTETIVLTLTQSPDYAVGTPGSATVNLTSDDAITETVTVAATAATVSEASSSAIFTFTRTGSSTLMVYYTVGGTATDGSDYEMFGKNVQIRYWEDKRSKPAMLLNDTLQEETETIIVTLMQSPNYAVGTPGSATANVISDDAITQTVTVAATDATATEAGPTAGRFTFTRTGYTAAALTAYFTVSGTATAGSDYQSLGTSVAFGAGVTTVTKTVTPVSDTLQEETETIIVTLMQSPNYAVGTPGSATVNLTSDEAVTQTVTVAATDAAATEAGLTTGRFTFTRTGDTATPLTAYFTVGGTATAGSDYHRFTTSVTFLPGVTTVVKTVTPVDDTLQEPTETIIVTLAQHQKYAVGDPGSATVNVYSNE
jgi:hypothetical protein